MHKALGGASMRCNRGHLFFMTGLLIERMNDDIVFQNPEDVSIEDLQDIEGDDWYSLLRHEPLLAQCVPFSNEDADILVNHTEYSYHSLDEDFEEIDEEEYEECDIDDEYDDDILDDEFFYFVSDERYSDFFNDSLDEDFEEDYHYGLLAINEYSVGQSSDLSLNDRRLVLTETYNDELPCDKGLSLLDWGHPKTFVRLRRIASIIAFHLRNAQSRNERTGADLSTSISDWQRDLAWLKTEFYDGIYDKMFQCPSGQI